MLLKVLVQTIEKHTEEVCKEQDDQLCRQSVDLYELLTNKNLFSRVEESKVDGRTAQQSLARSINESVNLSDVRSS
jgi:hypothetical protein